MRDVAKLREFAQQIVGEHTYNDGAPLALARELLAALDVVEAADKFERGDSDNLHGLVWNAVRNWRTGDAR